VSGLDIRLKRAYLTPSFDYGVRLLVDRLWPRGLLKSEAAVDHWLKELAPSTEHRRWFAHDPRRWDGFRRRYEIELSGNAGLLDQLQPIARRGRLTLVFAARDEFHNQAIVIRDFLANSLKT
jgi:uncharacterized protein YeaO (DUF488 family)